MFLCTKEAATPTVVPTLPASTPANELPSVADIAALGAKHQACLALPVAERVTLDAQGVVTAVSPTCSYAAADFKTNGRTWTQELGQYTFAKNLLTGATFGKGLIVFNAAPPNMSDPKEFKHPYCNTTTCVIVRYPVTTATGYAHSSDWILAKVNGEWNFVGNQMPYRTFVDPRLVRKIASSRLGAGAALGAGEPYYYKDRFESTLRLVFDLNSPNTNSVRAVRFSGPGLPPAGVVVFRSQRCGSDDIMSIAYQNGSTRVNTNPSIFQYWTDGGGPNFFLDAANLDGTPLAMPTPVLDATTAVAQNYSPTPIANQQTAIPAWSRYKVEIFRFDTLSDSPDEILYTRIASAAESAAQGYGKPWPTLAEGFVDNYLKPTGNSAGALSSVNQTMSWASLPNTFIWSGWLFGQNFATATNAQSETASYGVRSRLDFEPPALGDTSAMGIAFANSRSGVSMSTYTASTTTNPNPRCTSTDVVPLTSNTSDYREVGLSFRGADRKLYESIWFWDN